MNVSSMRVMLDPRRRGPGNLGAAPGTPGPACVSPRMPTSCIMITYGYAAAGSVLHGRRPAELLAGGGAAGRDAACGEPADPHPREAARPPAPRPLRAPGGADRGRTAPLPERSAAARTRGAAPRGARRGGGRRADRAPRDRRLHGPGW